MIYSKYMLLCLSGSSLQLSTCNYSHTLSYENLVDGKRVSNRVKRVLRYLTNWFLYFVKNSSIIIIIIMRANIFNISTISIAGLFFYWYRSSLEDFSHQICWGNYFLSTVGQLVVSHSVSPACAAIRFSRWRGVQYLLVLCELIYLLSHWNLSEIEWSDQCELKNKGVEVKTRRAVVYLSWSGLLQRSSHGK